MLVADAAGSLSPLGVVLTAAGELICGHWVSLVDLGWEEADAPAMRGALLRDSLGRLVGEFAERIG